MAEKTTATAEKVQNTDSQPKKATGDLIARRLAAVKANGHLTPKMQRGFDRLTASITNQ